MILKQGRTIGLILMMLVFGFFVTGCDSSVNNTETKSFMITFEVETEIGDGDYQPLADVEITFAGSKKNTSDQGLVSFNDLKDGVYGYQAVKDGYQSDEGSVTINGADEKVNIILIPSDSEVVGVSDEEKVAAAKNELELEGITDVIDDIELPGMINGVNISWESDNDEIIASDGKVSRPRSDDGDATVTLTATISINEASDSKEFIVTVKALDGIGIFAGGRGLEDDPFLIQTANDLNSLRSYLGEENSDFYFRQIEDIDLGSFYSWTPIGYSTTNVFWGNYDGDGYNIINLTINRPTGDDSSLFGYGNGAVFKNINLQNVNVIGGNYTSALISRLVDGEIINVKATGTVTGNGRLTGGLIAYLNGGLIDSSSADVEVSGNKGATGGLVGYMASGHILNSFAIGNVLGAIGNISGEDWYTGGLVGEIEGSNEDVQILIEKSYATGDVTGQISTGGFVGGFKGYPNNTIKESYSTGRVVGNDSLTGGFAGLISNNTRVENCYTVSNVTGTGYVGGFTGKLYGHVINSYSGAEITADSMVGGFTGEYVGDHTGSMENSYFDTIVAETFEMTGNKPGISGGLPTSELARQELLEYNGWSFGAAGIWNIIEGVSYPFFNWQGDDFIPYIPDSFAGGTGFYADPLQVETAEHLNNIRWYTDNELGQRYFIQTRDINLSSTEWSGGEGWEPIGTFEYEFSGIYDGNSKSISNLYINRPGTEWIGLFGRTDSADIKDLNLVDVEIIGGSHVGALVGYNGNSKIYNCHSSGIIEASGNDVGGLLGFNYDNSVENSSSEVIVEGQDRVGGLIGGANKGVTVKSFATGNVSGANSVGGLIGDNGFGSSIHNCYTTGDVLGTGSKIGGLSGVHQYSYGLKISKSYSVSYVNGASNVGGLIGYIDSAEIEDSYFIDTSINNGYGNPGSAEDLMSESNYVNWDFETIWQINEGISYPEFRNN